MKYQNQFSEKKNLKKKKMSSGEIFTQHAKCYFKKFRKCVLYNVFYASVSVSVVVNPCPAEPGYTLPFQTV